MLISRCFSLALDILVINNPAQPNPNLIMKILGIDPGLRITGFGIINVTSYNELQYIISGVIRTDNKDLASRLGTIFTGITELITEYQPDSAAIEKVFVNINPQSTLLLGQARGAAICALTNSKLTVAEYTALQLKQAITGYGKAKKIQIQTMIMQLLKLHQQPGSDAADALGVAVCHAHTYKTTHVINQKKPLGEYNQYFKDKYMF